jgi:hypothetical protein
MAAIFNAQLSEFGSHYKVVNVILSEAKYILPNAKFIALPNEVALMLKNQLNNGKVVSIDKELVDNPKSKDIPLDHFKIEEPNTLDLKKSATKARAQQRASAYSAMLTGFDILEFFMILGKFNSMGFPVMDENQKEEVFLNIINTGNEDLITDLERFLEIKDTFDKMMKKHRNIKQYFREVNECDTEEELQEVIDSNRGWLIN